MSLIGTLGEIKLADVLRLFATGKKSGLLTVADGAHQAQVRFQKGAIIHASAGRAQGQDVIFDLFGWKAGQLSFVPEERLVTPNISRDVDALIVEALKVGDSFHKMRELIPSDRVVFQMAEGPAEGKVYPVGRKAWSILRLADGVFDVAEIVDESELPRADVVQMLYELTQAGFLEKVDVLRMLRATSKGVSAKGLLGGDTAEVDERFDTEWRKVRRFENGALRIEIRTAARRSSPMSVSVRAGLVREVLLPRGLLSGLGLRDGDEVSVRPIA